MNDIEAFLGTEKEYELSSLKEFYNQFELMLTLDVKVMFLGFILRLGRRSWGALPVA